MRFQLATGGASGGLSGVVTRKFLDLLEPKAGRPVASQRKKSMVCIEFRLWPAGFDQANSRKQEAGRLALELDVHLRSVEEWI
jgi:hypothetical protein